MIVAVAASAALGGALSLMRDNAHNGTMGTSGAPDATRATVANVSPLAPDSARASALELTLADAANNARAEVHRANAERVLAAEAASTPASASEPTSEPASEPTSEPASTRLSNASGAVPNAQSAVNPLANSAAEPPPPSPSTPPSTPSSTPVGNGFSGGRAPETQTNPASAPEPATSGSTASQGASIEDALALAATNPVEARAMLSQALLAGTLSPIAAKQASDALVKIGAELFFTPNFNANDRHFFQYTVQSGDTLEKIVRRHKLGCDWRLVARINNIKRPEAIRVGQRLKLPKGPFSAVVWKRDYRVDLCMGAGSDRVVFTSLPCGLGKSNGTPVGRFKVRPGSKLLNPEWRNPITGEFFDANDQANPIGEYWLGLEGVEPSNSALLGYGMHGTIEPNSIGQDQSLGCVRLIADDIAIVWESLGDGCEVEIRP
jgi:hypothetical protein